MKDYTNDLRTVLTLDAGGTNFVFSAIRGNREAVAPVRMDSGAHDLDLCLKTMEQGFGAVLQALDERPVAISFAFPGPADYENGVIGDLPNLPAFRGGVALKGFLEERFGLPVYINNDGNLYAYGEALAGTLPWLNAQLAAAGNQKRYRNLIGVTLGTGFGAGVVLNGELLTGDNGCGGDVWVFRDLYHPEMIAEESVSIHAVRRMYAELSGTSADVSPKDICDIAAGRREGHREAAVETWKRFGHGLGNALCYALTLIDGVVAIGGGLSGAAPFFVPAMLEEMRGEMQRFGQSGVPRLQMDVYNLNDAGDLAAMLRREATEVGVPGSGRRVPYVCAKKTGVMVSSLSTSLARNLGAYNFALNELDR